MVDGQNLFRHSFFNKLLELFSPSNVKTIFCEMYIYPYKLFIIILIIILAIQGI